MAKIEITLSGAYRNPICLLLASCLLFSSSGCGLVAGAAVGTAEAVSKTGYTVYQGGKLAVVSVSGAVSEDDAQGVVFTEGRFETEAQAEITPVFKASQTFSSHH